MSRGADAAPSRSRYVGFTTLLAALCLIGLATSRAVAQGFPQQTEPTTTTVATAPAPPPPAPDPKPAPKPDPKPARPKQIVVRPKAPPPPPATVERAARRPIATTALPPKASPKAPGQKPKAASKTPAAATTRRRAVRPVRRTRRVTPPVTRGKPARPKRKTPVVPASQALDLGGPPVAFRSASKPVPLITVPTVLPLLLGIGIVLLLGASVASRRLVPWPGVAEPLYARRHDLTTAGFGAIALALLGLNAAVLF